MRIVRFKIGSRVSFGIVQGQSVKRIVGNPFSAIKYSGQRFKLSEVKLLAPCCPSKVVAVGLNYRSHAAELEYELLESPLIFLKPSTAVIGPEDYIT